MTSVNGGDKFVIPQKNMTEEYAKELHERMIEVREEYERVYLTTAQIAYEMMEGQSWKNIHDRNGKFYDSMDRYVQENFNIVPRTFRYLRDMWWWFCVENDSPKLAEALREIGCWTKARYLVGVITPDHADDWVKFAKEATREELENAARAAKKKANDDLSRTEKGAKAGKAKKKPAAEPKPVEPVRRNEPATEPDKSPEKSLDKVHGSSEIVRVPGNGGGAPLPTAEEILEEVEVSGHWQTIQFRIRREAKTVIDAAFAAAETMSGGRARHKGYLLEMICTSFCGQSGVAVEFQKEDLFRQLEEMLGVTIIAFEEPMCKVIYGEDSVRRLAGVEEQGFIDGECEVVDVD